MPKCGTTSIQRFMFRNRRLLEQKGCLYPKTLNGWDQHAELWPRYREVYTTDDPPRDVNSHYLTTLTTSPCDIALISAEQLSEASVKTYKFLSDAIDTRYIVYFRNPILHAQSAMTFMPLAYMNQKDRYGSPIFDLNAFQGYVSQQINQIDLFCGGDISSDSFIVKSFDQCSRNGGLIEDFYNTLGLTDFSDFSPPIRENVGLKTDYSFFLAHLNMIPLPQIVRRQIREELHELSANDEAARTYRLFSRAQVAAVPGYVIKRYKEIGLRAGDPDFWDRGLEEYLAMEECPYRQLPADTQQRIFASLSVDAQEAILDAWDRPVDTAGSLRGPGILPDIPTDGHSAWLIRQWFIAYSQLSLKLRPF